MDNDMSKYYSRKVMLPWLYGISFRRYNEQDLVNALRQSVAYIPELSLVTEIDGRIAGHIMFTKVQIGESVQLALAPLSVLPEYQRQGIGSALIREGHKRAGELGYGYSIVLGSEAYYPKAGYNGHAKTWPLKCIKTEPSYPCFGPMEQGCVF